MKKILFNNFKSKFREFFVQEGGAVAVLAALLFVSILGFAALTVDASLWFSQKRQLQFAADAGAVGGVIALRTTGRSTINTYATNDIQLNNCTSTSSCKIVSINNPPTSDPYAGDLQAVEVLLSKPADFFLSQLFLSSAPTIGVRAVATAGTAPINCFVTLKEAGLSLVGNSTLDARNCNVYSNNNISGVGSSAIIANTVSATGEITGNITAPGGIHPEYPPLPDPYAGLRVPSYAGCNYTNYSGTPANITPGVYCGGFSVIGGTVNMSPGVYIINGGPVNFHGGATINGSDVTFVFTSATGTDYPTLNDAGGNTFNLTAPTTGPFAGVVFFEDRNAPSPSIKFAGGSNFLINGAMYFPTGDVTYTGNSMTRGNSCLQVVAGSISLKGVGTVSSACGANAPAPPQLVE